MNIMVPENSDLSKKRSFCTKNLNSTIFLVMFVPEVRGFVPTISVVGEQYCIPYLVHLTVMKKVSFSSTQVDVFDHNSSLVLQVDGSFWQLKKKRTMFDAMGMPVITMRRKATLSLHKRWVVHRGESSDEDDLLYTVQKSHSFQLKTHLEVFLAGNNTGEACDFRVVGSYISRSFKIYKGETLIAEVKDRYKLGRLGKETFKARIYPGADYAFIVSLFVVLIDIDS